MREFRPYLGATLADMSEQRDPPVRRSRSGIEPRFLTLEDVAIYLNITGSQAYALVRSGDLPAIKVGGRGVWRVDRKQLEAYVERLHRQTEESARRHPLKHSE